MLKSHSSASSQIHQAVASITASSWMQSIATPDRAQIISANERTSLSALIAYVAHNSGENEFRIERRVADRFNVANVNFLSSADFDSAIRYLVDGSRLAAA